MAKRPTKMTEPAHSLMYTPGSLAAGKTFADTNQLYAKVTPYLKDAFNEKQESLFHDAFGNRISLLWGPPGTGKTTVLAGTILGWIEHYAEAGIPLRVGIGSFVVVTIEMFFLPRCLAIIEPSLNSLEDGWVHFQTC